MTDPAAPTPRYAVYFAPGADDPLWRFGSAVLGYDAATGAEVAPLVPDGFSAEEMHALTAEPRVYGFHATLKPPFRLAAGTSAAELVAAADAFAAGRAGFVLPAPALGAIGSFLALTPARPSPELDDLAADCVRAFDCFRAPAGAEERARRLAKPLGPRQVENLDRWGYPYVFEDFRFHMTLTGPVPEDRRTALAEALAAAWAGTAAPLPVGGITLFVQPEPAARFRILSRHGFGTG